MTTYAGRPRERIRLVTGTVKVYRVPVLLIAESLGWVARF